MHYKITYPCMPWELDYALLSFTQFKKSKYYLDGNDTIEINPSLNLSSSTKDLKEQILNQDIVSCSEITWTLLGLSAATVNLIIMLFFICINTIYIYRNYYGNEKKI